MYDFNQLRPLLDTAQITVAEAAEVFGASKPTLYSWCSGKGPTQSVLRRNAEMKITLIEKALAAGQLPLDINTDPTVRVRLIQSAMRKFVSSS